MLENTRQDGKYIILTTFVGGAIIRPVVPTNNL